MFSVYIIKSEKDDSFYIGSTSDYDNRIKEHNFGRTRYTKHRRPWKLVYIEEYQSRKEAIARERYLKLLKSKSYLNELIRRSRSLMGP